MSCIREHSLIALKIDKTNALKYFNEHVIIVPVYISLLSTETDESLIKELRNNLSVNEYIRKKARSIKHNIIDVCELCHDSTLLISLNCGHYLCESCQICAISKCPLCPKTKA